MWHSRRDFISFRKLCLLSRSRIVILILIHRDYSTARRNCPSSLYWSGKRINYSHACGEYPREQPPLPQRPPMQSMEKNYAAGLLKIVRNSLAYGKCTLAILHYAVPECKVKVKSHPYKIMGEVSRFLESSFDGKVHYEPTESFSELVRSSLGQSMPEDMLMDEFLEGVLSCARGVSLKKRNL